jgi:protein-L-isoaspartate(D-aspartate) O-methyltransferase
MASADSARQRMVQRQLVDRGLRAPQVQHAMRAVPREAFVPRHLREFAYDDTPLPIEEGQTISQPYIVALMIEAAEVKPGDRVLEIGTGSAYAAAVLAEITGPVETIERHPGLARSASARLHDLGYGRCPHAMREGMPETYPFGL